MKITKIPPSNIEKKVKIYFATQHRTRLIFSDLLILLIMATAYCAKKKILLKM